MRELRSEIERLEQDYRSIRYPGDLALDVPESSTPSTLRLGSARLRGLLALAASVAVAGVIWTFVPGNEPTQVVTESQKPAEVIVSTDEAGAASDAVDAVKALEATEPVIPNSVQPEPQSTLDATPVSDPAQAV